ncbi:hypothetical protein BLA29_003361 [Euroglyphus maynei]|uniref:Poly [ADP-ribose] polymerase n=1 Tax=Euroglyphus maynei TaxID=6958 RepID=A0A1Y3BQ52_EURMA|nr:hypothetical protein BLA29_003361 [Euroglyphus maynei]
MFIITNLIEMNIFFPGKSQSKSQKVVIKDGIAVFPDSGLQDKAHVYKKGNDIYSVVLNLVDLNTNKNSYYKMQLLQDDRNGQLFTLFKSWGRIGTEVGKNKIETYSSLTLAIAAFKRIYYERTLNLWCDRHHFVKHPNSYYPVEIDYNDKGESSQVIKIEESTSLLPLPVKELIVLLFDIQNIKRTMLEFELDLEKMPLGKLSKKRILDACEALKYISNLLKQKPVPQNELVGACNKFYSLVPHNFGMEKPPLIISQNMVAKKNEMLESLLEIELTYEIISNNDNSNKNEDLIDYNYRKLKAEILPIDRNDDDFKLIEKYIENTHAKTHNFYTLEIINIFRLNREGEAERFSKYKNNSNRMLLWHGSRLTNFVGIISQGLRIAPKEAPVSGYMFGKGVYFADSVSKSANYCYTCSDNSIGLLALSEVAIGNSKELVNAEYIKELPENYQSVKGIGQSHPNPKEMVITKDGVKIPLGKMIQNTKPDNQHLSLLYNEYIVYSEEQINMKYLIQVRFNYKNLF